MGSARRRGAKVAAGLVKSGFDSTCILLASSPTSKRSARSEACASAGY